MRTHEVIERFADALEGLEGWRRSVFSPAALLHRDGGPPGKTWSVEVPSTSPIGSRRGSRGDVPHVTDEVVVRWTWRLRADGAVADYDAALQAEDAIVALLSAQFGDGLDRSGLGPVVLLSMAREVTGDETAVVGTMRWQVVARPWSVE